MAKGEISRYVHAQKSRREELVEESVPLTRIYILPPAHTPSTRYA